MKQKSFQKQKHNLSQTNGLLLERFLAFEAVKSDFNLKLWV